MHNGVEARERRYNLQNTLCEISNHLKANLGRALRFRYCFESGDGVADLWLVLSHEALVQAVAHRLFRPLGGVVAAAARAARAIPPRRRAASIGLRGARNVRLAD